MDAKAKPTIAILTDETTRTMDSPLVIHLDRVLKHISDSGLDQPSPMDGFVLGRVGQESVLFTHAEALELMAFLKAALKK